MTGSTPHPWKCCFHSNCGPVHCNRAVGVSTRYTMKVQRSAGAHGSATGSGVSAILKIQGLILGGVLFCVGCKPEHSAPSGDSLLRATLLETLRYRDQYKRDLFDGVIREATRIVCLRQGVETDLIEFASIDELFPMSRIATATSAGCGYLISPDGRMNGVAFDRATLQKQR